MAGRHPFVTVLKTNVVAQGTAGTAQAAIIGEAPFAATVTEVSIIPQAGVTANASNYRIFTVYNRGTDGSGTTVVATLDTSTTGLTDNDERLATLSATAANLALADGDVLEVAETVAASGVAHGGYQIAVKLSRS